MVSSHHINDRWLLIVYCHGNTTRKTQSSTAWPNDGYLSGDPCCLFSYSITIRTNEACSDAFYVQTNAQSTLPAVPGIASSQGSEHTPHNNQVN